jgi:hypothetical protein
MNDTAYLLSAVGTIAVPVFPVDRSDRMGIGAAGVTAEIWLAPNVEEAVREWEGGTGSGRVSLVLGAGNQTFLGIVDLLDTLFIQVCLKAFSSSRSLRPHSCFKALR